MTTSAQRIRASVNGAPVESTVPVRLTLAEFLRDHLGLTGTKLSCEMQVCGVCTVLVDGRPVSACTYLAADIDGREVTTIEGLSDGETLHPIQQAFADEFALQCGFCTPGFVMMAKALLDENPQPQVDDVVEYLEGNICRCTGYQPIVNAVMRAADALLESATPRARRSMQVSVAATGEAKIRVDAGVKVTGEAKFAVDLSLPGMLYGCAVRSQRAHARILGIDARPALELDGVVAVVTAADLEGLFPHFGHLIADHPILAIDKVRYWGEPVALVIGESPHAAADGVQRVEVEYEDLPALMNPTQALAEGAPLIHETAYPRGDASFDEAVPREGLSNIAHEVALDWGDVDAAFTAAAHVVETSVRYPMLYAYAMEPYNALADYGDAELRVYTTAQHPFMVRQDLARVFSLPLARVRVISPFLGGGYGSKSYTKVEPLAAVGSWAVRRPLKLALDVEEAIHTTRADSAAVRIKSAFDAEGRLLARDVDLVLDSGAYADNSPLVLSKACNRCFGPYRVPNLRVRGKSVYTNTVAASSYRGFGAPQGTLASELNLDRAAQELGIDPAELRKRNLLEPGDELLPGKRPLDADLKADLDMVLETLAWQPEPGSLRGMGVGCSASDAGALPVSTASVKILPDGSALLLTGSTEMGQGSRTALAQIVTRELGIEEVQVLQSDTSVTPFERTTGASRTTVVTGIAILRACADARSKLEEMAAELFRCTGAEVELTGGRVEGPGGAVRSVGEVIRGWFGANGGEVTGIGLVRRTGELEKLPPFWEIGMVGVEVSVDPETGRVRVEHLVTVGDVGYAINPALVEGQDLGAATQGLGAALFEELVYDGPQLLNPNVVEYRVPRTTDMPRRIDTLLAERGDGVGPYGAKGAGEGALNPVGAAVASAIGRAVGRWPERLPLTPERVWRLLNGLDDVES